MKDLTMEERLVSMWALFDPESIAIIGASANPVKPSGQPLVALLNNGYKGKIYPVNPNYNRLYNLPCYPSLSAVPGNVDMAIIAISAAHTMAALEECAEKGVKAAVIFTSGFAEVGGEGVELQKEITRLVREKGIMVCGPNCMGIFSAHNALMANFAVTTLPEKTFINDFLGFISQSGGFGCALYEMVRDRGIGFSHFISTGNEADVEFSEYLAYMAGDPRTRVIGGYLEGVKNGPKMVRAAQMALEAEKPVLLIKSGRNEVAARAAASHTGALVGSDRVYDSLFKQKGIIRVESIEELTATLSVLVSGKLPRGRNVCILATSGGSGVLLADKCAEYGLEVPPLTPQTREKLDKLLPSFASSANPVDITSQIMTQPGLLKQCAEVVLADPRVDILILCYWALHGDIGKNLEEINSITKGTDKVVMNLVWGPEEPARQALKKLHEMLVPAARESEYAVKSLGALSWYNHKVRVSREVPGLPEIPENARENVAAILGGFRPGARLTEYQAKQVLRAYGIPCTREKLALNQDEAVHMANLIGYPVVLKIESPDILHKTDAGGVKLNLDSPERVREAYREITAKALNYKSDADLKGVLVQEMLPPGTELIVGIGRDNVFGSIVLFGLGGIFVEALQDVAMRIPPLTRADAMEMVDEIKGQKVLDGVRGKPSVDRNALVDILLRVAQLAGDFPQIEELDINPLVAYHGGIAAADALLVLKGE